MQVEKTLSDLGDKLSGWFEGFVLLLPNLLVAVLVLLLAWLGARLSKGLISRVMRRLAAPRQIEDLVATVGYLSVLGAGVIVALGVVGLEKTVTSLLAGAGILGLALAFALQDLAANVVSGVMLTLRRPIRIGDLVETNDFFGTVARINLRSTELRTPEGKVVLIPNKEIFESPIVNYSTRGERRVDLQVGVTYDTDLALARRVAVDAVRGVPGRVGNREVELFWEEFADSAIQCVVRFWIPTPEQRAFLQARSEAVERIKAAFDSNGITIPFPIRTLDLAGLDERLVRRLTSPAAVADGEEEHERLSGGGDEKESAH